MACSVHRRGQTDGQTGRQTSHNLCHVPPGLCTLLVDDNSMPSLSFHDALSNFHAFFVV